MKTYKITFGLSLLSLALAMYFASIHQMLAEFPVVLGFLSLWQIN